MKALFKKYTILLSVLYIFVKIIGSFSTYSKLVYDYLSLESLFGKYPFLMIELVTTIIIMLTWFIAPIFIFTDRKKFHIPKSTFIMLIIVTVSDSTTGIMLLMIAEYYYYNIPNILLGKAE